MASSIDQSISPVPGRRRLAGAIPHWPSIPASILHSTMLCLLVLIAWETMNLSPGHAARPLRLTQTAVDPNTASWASLTRLPGIGPARATKIIAYRGQRLLRRPGHKPFRNLQSMRKIKGFGPVTLRNLAPFLRFNSSVAPTTSDSGYRAQR